MNRTAPLQAAPANAAVPGAGLRLRSLRRALGAAGVAALACAAAGEASTLRWMVAIDGQSREALVVPAARLPDEAGSPVVFALHGRSDSAASLAKSLRIEDLYPEAIVVYPQAAPARPAAPRRGARQRQPAVDAETRLFDAMLDRIGRSYRIDLSRVHVLGASDGTRTALTLWRVRPGKVASLCLVALRSDLDARTLAPRSVLMVDADGDAAASTIGSRNLRVLLERFGLEADAARPPSGGRDLGGAEFAKGMAGTEFGVLRHPGAGLPPAAAMETIVSFFRRNTVQGGPAG